MERNAKNYDPYEKEQARLRRMLEDISTDEEDPYADDDGEFSSDKNYEPGEDSEQDSDENSSSDLDTNSELLEPDSSQKNLRNLPPGGQRQGSSTENSDEPSTSHDESLESAWETTTAPIPNFNFDESTNRLKVDFGPQTTPLQVFEHLFTPTILDYLVECTNVYGQELTTTNRPKTRNSRNAAFRPVSNDEMKKFLGLCLLQGQISTTNMRRYFTYKDVLYFHPIFSYVMSARRFEQILRVISCSPRKATKKEKVQHLIDMLISKFQEVYSPSKELSIDESLLHFRGRLGFRVYIKNKKTRYGIKFFELCTSDGYLLNMEMYSGLVEENVGLDITKTEAVVMRLMKPYLNKGHELFMDNYYNSYELSEKLLSFKTHTNGTLRSNRKSNPKPLIQKKLKKGEHFWVRRKQVYVSKWKDKREVLVITTRNHPRMINTRNKFGKETMKPEEVKTYNDHMSGIDRCDQMTSTYSSPRKTIRWYKKVIFHLLDVTVWNAFYLYRKFCKNNSPKYLFIQFRDELIKSLIEIPAHFEGKDVVRREKHDNRRTSGEQASNETTPVIPDLGGHWPMKNPGTPGPNSKKKSVFLKCRMCTSKGKRKETSYLCKGCVNKPPLCPDCFEEWHMLQK